jgi:hypothetical protein
MERALNDARSQAYLASQDAALKERQQIVTEELMQRNQPINEYSAWATGSQIATPTFQNQNLTPPQPPQYLDAADMQAQYDLGIYNADVTGANALTSGLFDLGGSYILSSDIRLKHNIEYKGKMESGIPVYEFSYKGHDERHTGVMAQDVIKTQPEAVVLMDNGYYAVDYGVLK